MANVKPLVRHSTRGYPTEIDSADALEAPSFKASNASGSAFDANNLPISNVGAPTQGAHAATKAYVDGKLSGFAVREPVRVMAPQAAINLAAPGANVDGVAMALNDRVGVFHQAGAGGAAHADNGIYLWKGAAVPMVRAEDDLISGASYHVREGAAARANSTWVLTSPDTAITPGTTAIQFTEFTGADRIVAGTALSRSGNTLNVQLGTTSSTAAAGNHAHTITAGTGLSGGGSVANGGSVTLSADIGTGSTQVAAGNHTHTAANVGAVPTSRQVIAGEGLSGGGALSGDVTLHVELKSLNPGLELAGTGNAKQLGVIFGTIGGSVAEGSHAHTVTAGAGLSGGGAIANGAAATLDVELSGDGSLEFDAAGVGGKLQVKKGQTLYATPGGGLEVLTQHGISGGGGSGLFSYATLEDFTAGEALAAYDVVALNGSGQVVKASTAEARANVVGIAQEAAASGARVKVVTQGIATKSGVTAGPEYFLSATAGALATTPPSSGRVVRVGFGCQHFGNAANNLHVQIADFGAI